MKNKTTLIAEPGKQEVIVSRVFNAPRELVFRVMNDPDALSKWWGPHGHDTTVIERSSTSGSTWRVMQRDAKGNEFGFHGVNHEITAPKRTIRTFEFEGMPGHVLLETSKFEDLDGKTKLTSQLVFQSVADRDGMVGAGMERGTVESHERFDELIASMLVTA